MFLFVFVVFFFSLLLPPLLLVPLLPLLPPLLLLVLVVDTVSYRGSKTSVTVEMTPWLMGVPWLLPVK